MRRLSLSVVLGLSLAAVGTIALAGRNTAGSYSPPVGTLPVIPGSTISSSAFNGLMTDMGTELTSSLDRNGRGGMLAPIRTPDGAVSAPAHSFTNEIGTGFYRAGNSDLALSLAGTKRQEWTASLTAITGNLQVTSLAGTTGAIYLVNNGTRALAYDGTYYTLGGAELQTVAPTTINSAATKGYVDGRTTVTWTDAVYSTGWQAGTQVKCAVDVLNVVHLKGTAYSPTNGVFTSMVTLPLACRPATARYALVACLGAGYSVKIGTDGVVGTTADLGSGVTPTPGTLTCALDGLTFSL